MTWLFCYDDLSDSGGRWTRRDSNLGNHVNNLHYLFKNLQHQIISLLKEKLQPNSSKTIILDSSQVLCYGMASFKLDTGGRRKYQFPTTPSFPKIHSWKADHYLSRLITKQTMWLCAQRKTQISLGMRPVWSESSLSAWRKFGALATHWAHSQDSYQTGRMPRLIWVFAGRTTILLVLSWGGNSISEINCKTTTTLCISCWCWRRDSSRT